MTWREENLQLFLGTDLLLKTTLYSPTSPRVASHGVESFFQLIFTKRIRSSTKPTAVLPPHVPTFHFIMPSSIKPFFGPCAKLIQLWGHSLTPDSNYLPCRLHSLTPPPLPLGSGGDLEKGKKPRGLKYEQFNNYNKVKYNNNKSKKKQINYHTHKKPSLTDAQITPQQQLAPPSQLPHFIYWV